MNPIELDIKCSSTSLIGVMGKPPHSWANYFWIDDWRVVNMWWENLKAANGKFRLGGKVRGYEFTRHKRKETDPEDQKFFLVTDERIPQDWTTKKLCFTGGYRPSLEIIKKMYELDPNLIEIDEWLDPVAYHASKGGSYNPKTGVITYNIKPKSNPLPVGYTIVIENIMPVIHGDILSVTRTIEPNKNEH